MSEKGGPDPRDPLWIRPCRRSVQRLSVHCTRQLPLNASDYGRQEHYSPTNSSLLQIFAALRTLNKSISSSYLFVELLQSEL